MTNGPCEPAETVLHFLDHLSTRPDRIDVQRLRTVQRAINELAPPQPMKMIEWRNCRAISAIPDEQSETRHGDTAVLAYLGLLALYVGWCLWAG